MTTPTQVKETDNERCNEPIVFSEPSFDEFVAAILGEPERPSQTLLDAVALYKEHQPVRIKKR